MDDENALPLESRPPTKEDLLLLCRSLNAQAAKYVIVGGFAIIEQGFTRATMDIDLLVEGSEENIRRVRAALEVLPDKAVRELNDGDLEQFIVVRVADEIIVDLMLKTCGIAYDEALPEVETRTVDGVPIPFASVKLLWRMKQTYREKDALDREFLRQKLGEQGGK